MVLSLYCLPRSGSRNGVRLLIGTLGWLSTLASKASFVLELVFPVIGTYCLVARRLSLLGDFGVVSMVRNLVGTFQQQKH